MATSTSASVGEENVRHRAKDAENTPLPASTVSWAHGDDCEETTASLTRHSQIVSQVSAQAKDLYDRGLPYRIFHGSSNTTRPRDGSEQAAVLDISALDQVLRVDVAARRALVEPNVPMDRLVSTVHRVSAGRLMPPVVMEFPGITAGGGFAGTGGESSSFRHGFFDETVTRIEMLLADGTVVVAADETENGADPLHSDLFHAAGGAVGSLGTVTLLEIRLVPARKWVRTTYRRTSSVSEAVDAVQAAVKAGLSEETNGERPDFVDGILYSQSHGIVVTGVLTDDKPADVAVQTFSDPWDPWFYIHAYYKTAETAEAVDYVPLAEYLFRYDRGGFWVGRTSFLYFFMVPFTRLMRWLFDDVLHTRMMYRAMHAGGGAHAFVLQDMAVPFGRADQLVVYTAENFGIWPLWLCPLRRRASLTFHPAVLTSETGPDDVSKTHMLNVGLWGRGPLNRSIFRQRNEALEAKLTSLGGRKWLYASTYFAEDDFWNLYGGRSWYDVLRAKYRAAGALPSVFDKVHVRNSAGETAAPLPWSEKIKFIWPLGGILGILYSLRTGDQQLHRHAEWRYKAEKQ